MYGLLANTDEEYLDKRTLTERPVADEIGWCGCKTAMRHFTGVDDREGFVVEVDVTEDIDYTVGSPAAARRTGWTRPTPSQPRFPRPLTSSTRIYSD